jgi:hypothetical protein
MPRDAVVTPPERRLPFTNPWPLLGVALGTAVLVMLLHAFAPHLAAARAFLIVVAMLTALGGVGVRLRSAREAAENRFNTAGIVALACAVPLFCRVSLDAEWDSVGLLLDVFIGVGLAAAALILLPRLVRRLTLTVLVLIHFCGILSAVGSPAPAGGERSWLINQLWGGVYRPYLHFMYLNNAYHFYSPDPGPPILVWFRAEYEGGKSRWIEVPNLGEERSKLAFQRRLALGESTNQLQQQPPWDFDERWARRIEAGRNFKGRGSIPPLNDPVYGRYFEYREPIAYSKRILESYARYVLSHYPYVDEQGMEHPELKPLKVKLYRVIHAITDTKNFAEGFSPFHPITYLPYYQGEFDTAGRQLDGPTYKDGQLDKPGDPFLYWLIPIKVEPKDGYVQRFDAQGRPVPPEAKDVKLVDYLRIHAGDAESFWDKRQR